MDTIRVEQSLKVDSDSRVIIVRVIYSKKDLGGHAHEPQHLYQKGNPDTEE